MNNREVAANCSDTIDSQITSSKIPTPTASSLSENSKTICLVETCTKIKKITHHHPNLLNIYETAYTSPIPCRICRGPVKIFLGKPSKNKCVNKENVLKGGGSICKPNFFIVRNKVIFSQEGGGQSQKVLTFVSI